MKMIQAIALALVLGGGAVSLADAQAGQPLQRTDLLKNDIDVPGHEVVQVRVDFAPGVLAAKHSHPGEEIAYVLEGTLEYQLQGKQPVTPQSRPVPVHSFRRCSLGKECRQRRGF